MKGQGPYLAGLAALALWTARAGLASGAALGSLALVPPALGLGVLGRRPPRAWARAASLLLLAVAYVPPGLAEPPLALLAFSSLALLEGLLGAALPLLALGGVQRVSGAAAHPGPRWLATLGAATLASFSLAALLLNSALLLAFGGASEWSALAAALAILALVTLLATLPRRGPLTPGAGEGGRGVPPPSLTLK